MSERKAKAARAERKAQGLSPFADPVHNFLPEEAEATRSDRRLRTKHKKRYAVELERSNPIKNQQRILKWNRVYMASELAFREKQMAEAADKILMEMDAEEAEVPIMEQEEAPA